MVCVKMVVVGSIVVIPMDVSLFEAGVMVGINGPLINRTFPITSLGMKDQPGVLMLQFHKTPLIIIIRTMEDLLSLEYLSLSNI